jgi:hypothetical protein
MNRQQSGQYKKLLKAIELVNISNIRGEYSRIAQDCEMKPNVLRTIQTSRASFQPPFIVSGGVLVVPVAYRVEASSDNKPMARFEYQYEVRFSIREEGLVTSILMDEIILGFFTGYQMDKLVWSYLRCNLSETCTRMGINRIVLPLLR